MSRAKELLERATPLPWRNEDWPAEIDADAALIVYAVNRLPDYEAAVDMLRRWRDGSLAGDASTLGDLTDATTDLLDKMEEGA